MVAGPDVTPKTSSLTCLVIGAGWLLRTEQDCWQDYLPVVWTSSWQVYREDRQNFYCLQWLSLTSHITVTLVTVRSLWDSKEETDAPFQEECQGVCRKCFRHTMPAQEVGEGRPQAYRRQTDRLGFSCLGAHPSSSISGWVIVGKLSHLCGFQWTILKSWGNNNINLIMLGCEGARAC